VLTYQNDTRLTHIGQSGGQNADVGFDNLRRTIDHRWESFTPGTTALGNGTALVHFGYGFDRRNNKLREEKFHASGDSEVYAYDSIYRVTDFDRGTLNAGKTAIATPTATTGALQAQDWTLDGVHNWNANTHTTAGTPATENRGHTDFNEINQVTGTPYGGAPTRTDTHDKNGNLRDDGTLSYEWDAKNRLKAVTRKSDSKVIAEYVYDCDNRRMEKTISNGGITGTTANGTTRYYYHGWQVLQEEDGSDAVQRQYVYGTYIDEPWVLDDRSSSQSIADLNDGSGSDRQFYHCNTQYSIHALSDETGALTEGYQYDAYGRQYVYAPGTNGTIDWGGDDVITANGASAVDNEYMYTGRRFNPELENYYFRNRYYDSLRGRFVGRDLLGFVDGMSLYSSYFVINQIDYSGLGNGDVVDKAQKTIDAGLEVVKAAAEGSTVLPGTDRGSREAAEHIGESATTLQDAAQAVRDIKDAVNALQGDEEAQVQVANRAIEEGVGRLEKYLKDLKSGAATASGMQLNLAIWNIKLGFKLHAAAIQQFSYKKPCERCVDAMSGFGSGTLIGERATAEGCKVMVFDYPVGGKTIRLICKECCNKIYGIVELSPGIHSFVPCWGPK